MSKRNPMMIFVSLLWLYISLPWMRHIRPTTSVGIIFLVTIKENLLVCEIGNEFFFYLGGSWLHWLS